MQALVAAAKAEGIQFHVVINDEGEWLHKTDLLISDSMTIKGVEFS